MRSILYIFFALAAGISVRAQEQIGIAGSTHAPVNTVWMNPATIADSRAFIDIELTGACLFARNNFVFIPGSQFSMSGIRSMNKPSYAREHAPYNVCASLRLDGPSATFAFGKHAFGIHTAVRMAADGRGIPETLGYYITEGFQYREQMGIIHSVKNLRTNALAWMEVGATYATIIGRHGDRLTLGGLTVNKLIGIAGAGIRLDEWQYMVKDSSNMETYTLRGEYGFNDPAFNSGSGWSADIGISVKKRFSESTSYEPFSPCTDGDYKYRYGISLLDIGRIRFQGNFYRNVFNETEQSEWSDFSNTTADDTAALDSLLNAGFHASQSNSDENKFHMFLPAGLNGQIDYNFGHHVYVFATLQVGIPWKNSLGVQRASLIGCTPRYELKRFEIALPFSMYEFRYPQLGVMVRLNSIVIGSDNLGPLLFNQDAYGADVYFSLKYTIFRHWKCKEKKAKPVEDKKGDGRWVPCPTW